jgi:hypothetical protein
MGVKTKHIHALEREKLCSDNAIRRLFLCPAWRIISSVHDGAAEQLLCLLLTHGQANALIESLF